MHERLQSAFSTLRAEEGLKERTMDAVRQRAGRYGAHRRRVRALACAAVCLLFSIGLGGGLFFTPVSAISIDINPSLELTLNRFDRVIGVEGYNEDGKELARNTDVLFADYPQALGAVLGSAAVQECLERGEALSIFVACDDEQRGQEILANVESCAGGGGNVQCLYGGWAENAAAKEAGLSCGKYRAFLELQALDPTATPEDVQGLTMREIREKISALTGEPAPAGGCGKGCRGGRHGKHTCS